MLTISRKIVIPWSWFPKKRCFKEYHPHFYKVIKPRTFWATISRLHRKVEGQKVASRLWSLHWKSRLSNTITTKMWSSNHSSIAVVLVNLIQGYHRLGQINSNNLLRIVTFRDNSSISSINNKNKFNSNLSKMERLGAESPRLKLVHLHFC